MNNSPSSDFTAYSEKSALVALDDDAISRPIVSAVGEMGFDVQLSFSTDDAQIKLRSHPYDIIIISSVTTSANCDADQIYLEILELPIDQRRRQFITMIGPNLRSGDVLQAFLFSVDFVFNTADLSHLKRALTYAINQRNEKNRILFDCMETVDMAFL